ncbi:MAG: glycosyl transferase family 2 [Paraprevotella sp.]|nr:glycosyl transferase family 2 [Paraprevotella sp.]
MVEFEYTAVIRTLGTAGEKYQQLLDSLQAQTIAPQAIIVYIAEGYPLPKETIGTERYVYVKKGMVAQRALPYDEVQTEWMLFLDDDVYLPPKAVETLYIQLREREADVISPDVFPNAKRSPFGELMMTLSGRMRARRGDDIWGYKVMRTAGYSYNANPTLSTYWSQTNAGPCFMCKKQTFLDIHFEEELWLDKLAYPLGEDQVMFYKMYLLGKKLLTSYNSGIVHLDAGSMRTQEKEMGILYADLRFKILFWYRFLYSQEKNYLTKAWDAMCLMYLLSFALFISLVKCRWDVIKVKRQAVRDARSLIKSGEVAVYKLQVNS